MALDILANGSCKCFFVYPYLLLTRDVATAEALKRADDKYTLSVTFFYIAAYAFITGSSFVYIDYFGIPSKYYGFLFGVNILGVAALSFFKQELGQ